MDELMTVHGPLYLLLRPVPCWQCGHAVVAVAVGATEVRDADDDPMVEHDPSDIVLLKYVQSLPEDVLAVVRAQHPGWELAYSKTAGCSYYATRCGCGAMLGDHDLFGEEDEGFAVTTPDQAAQVAWCTLPFDGVYEIACDPVWGAGALIRAHGMRLASPTSRESSAAAVEQD